MGAFLFILVNSVMTVTLAETCCLLYTVKQNRLWTGLTVFLIIQKLHG